MHGGKQEKNPLQSPLVFSSSIFHLCSTFCTGLKLNSSAWWPAGPVSLNFLSPRSTLSGPGFRVYLKERGMCLQRILSHGLPSLSSNCFEMFVIFCFFRNFCLIPAHLPYVAFFFVGGGSQSERNPHIMTVFSSWFSISKLFTRGSQGSSSDESKVLWERLESHESVQSLGFNPFPFKTTKCSWDSKKLDSGKRKKGSPTKQLVILFLF